MHFEVSDTRIKFVERQNYFHKQSRQGVEILTDQKKIQDGAVKYFYSESEGGRFF
jgi:hypothetical protein